MKCRSGFVSNSSSSSFVLFDKETTAADFFQLIKDFWNEVYEAGETTLDPAAINEVCKFINVQEMKTPNAIRWIEKAYKDECWSAREVISKNGKMSYLKQALKANVFGTSQDNEIPYQVLDKLSERFGNKLIIHHLG